MSGGEFRLDYRRIWIPVAAYSNNIQMSRAVFDGLGTGNFLLGLDADGCGGCASAGVQVPFLQNSLIEATLHYHNVDAADDPEFVQYHAGIRVPY